MKIETCIRNHAELVNLGHYMCWTCGEILRVSKGTKEESLKHDLFETSSTLQSALFSVREICEYFTRNENRHMVGNELQEILDRASNLSTPTKTTNNETE